MRKKYSNRRRRLASFDKLTQAIETNLGPTVQLQKGFEDEFESHLYPVPLRCTKCKNQWTATWLTLVYRGGGGCRECRKKK